MKENEATEKYNLLFRHWAYDTNHVDDVNANFPNFYSGETVRTVSLLVTVCDISAVSPVGVLPFRSAE